MIWLLTVLLCLSVGFSCLLLRQIDNLARQLRENRRMVGVELFARRLSRLAGEINRMLRREADARICHARAERSLKETMSGISHDLRTPLTAVIGYLQLCEPSENVLMALKRARELSRRIDQFYLLALEEQGAVPCVPKDMDLARYLLELLADDAKILEDAGISPELLGFEAPVRAKADEMLLARVVQNLLANCARHGRAPVRIALSTEADAACLTIQNATRVGAAPDADAFFRRPGGLGMNIVGSLMERMGGGMRVRAEEGVFCVQVWLPTAESSNEYPKIS